MQMFHFKVIKTTVLLEDISGENYDDAVNTLEARLKNYKSYDRFKDTEWDYHLMSSNPMELNEELHMWTEVKQ